MQASTVTVLPTRRGKHALYRVSYGPYNTLCTKECIWDTKQQLLKLPINKCPTCKRHA